MKIFCPWNLFPLLVILATAVIACGSASSPPTFQEFMDELQAGASCEELFATRLAIKRSLADPGNSIIDKINIELSFIGCTGASGTRWDLAGKTPNPEHNFTLNEYRIYRSVVDTPLSVSDDQAFRNAAEKYGVTVEEAPMIFDKVELALLTNDWFARPEAEIRGASDWQGETK